MLPKSVLSLLIFVSFFIHVQRVEAQDIENGSFETYTVPPREWTFPGVVDFNIPVGGKDLVGWDVINGPVDYVGSFWVASDGGASIDLGGSPGEGGLRQSVETIPGVKYTLSFDLSGNPDPDGISEEPPLKTMELSIADETFKFSYDIDIEGNTLSDMKWRQESVVFSATSTSTNIQFVNTMGDVREGPVIDNVSLDEFTLTGDVNCDGVVNLLDVAPFVEVLSSGGYEVKADINQDGVVDLLDVAPFVDLLSGG